jgi:hypothetical protein
LATQLIIYVTSSGSTTVSVEVAHSGNLTSEGILPEGTPGTWHALTYTGITMSIAFAGAGSTALMIPDVPFGLVRLSNLTGAVNLTAGWESSAG